MDTTQEMVIPLWPEGAAGSEDWDQVEEATTRPDGLPIVRNITQPSLIVYPAEKPNGAAVIVAPGGAWHFVAIEHEGREVAKWFAARGITVFILKYRLLRTGDNLEKELEDFFKHDPAKEAQLQALKSLNLADARQAMRIVRQRATEWGVEPHKIGFMGFSAGGGVTTQIALEYTPDCRPDFAAPIYPAVFEEVKAPVDAPPLFLLCAQDDAMATHASMFLYSAWSAVHRPVELHIYASGGHGFGMYKKNLPVDTWIERMEEWLKGLKIV
jgi:acetyl esterase/lipase